MSGTDRHPNLLCAHDSRADIPSRVNGFLVCATQPAESNLGGIVLADITASSDLTLWAFHARSSN